MKPIIRALLPILLVGCADADEGEQPEPTPCEQACEVYYGNCGVAANADQDVSALSSCYAECEVLGPRTADAWMDCLDAHAATYEVAQFGWDDTACTVIEGNCPFPCGSDPETLYPGECPPGLD